MVENPGTALAIGVADAQATDGQINKRLREIATAGKENPGSLKAADVGELCSAILRLLPAET